MAGVGKDAVIVDVVAAARRVAERNAVPAATVTAIEQKATDVFGGLADTQPPVKCALGHETPAGFRFCPTCGLPMDAQLPGTVVPDRPRPAAELTAEERRRRDEQHQAAIAANAQAEQLVVDLAAQEDPSEVKVRIHFVSDGFTFGGRVWHVGDELEIGPEHPRWQQVLPWISLTKPQQVERWGRVFFDTGPWPYRQLPPGTQMMLPELGANQLALLRQGQQPPARGAGDMPNSLIPR